MIIFGLLLANANAQSTSSAPPSCPQPVDVAYCAQHNWQMPGEDICKPSGPIPVSGKQVYIKDPLNFCILLPNQQTAPKSNGIKPSILDGEGYVQSYCMGELSPGALPLPKGGIRSAHIKEGIHVSGKKYFEIYGKMDCDILNLNCEGDNGGQYDTVEWKYCGHEPYSGVFSAMNPKLPHYVQQGSF